MGRLLGEKGADRAPDVVLAAEVTGTDRRAAGSQLGEFANYVGYVETASIAQQPLQSETALLFEQLEAATHAAGRHALASPESVWDAIRAFFSKGAEVEV